MAVQFEQGAAIPLEQLIAHLKSKADTLREKVSVSAIYLFGSHAAGHATCYSDVDLAVISPVLGDNIISEGVMLMNTFDDAGKNIFTEPLIYSPDDLETAESGTFLHDEIIKKGIRIC
jgi:predicted nucleotidyltransferase